MFALVYINLCNAISNSVSVFFSLLGISLFIFDYFNDTHFFMSKILQNLFRKFEID